MVVWMVIDIKDMRIVEKVLNEFTDMLQYI